MWLDRFSGQSTPSGAVSPSRSYSPAPRRPSHLAPRSGLGLRDNRSSTSLDLSANVSSVSLGSTSRNVNGSGLRYEQKPPADVQDPQKVLQDILGLNRNGETERKKGRPSNVNVADEDIQIPFGGLSLQEFVDQDIPFRNVSPSVNAASGITKQKLEEFHRSIFDADQVLKTVEVYLTNFKADLGQVSGEIENLQNRSVQLNARLENRRQVEKLLGPAVEDVSISPVTVRAIAEGPIDGNFMKALTEVEARIDILEKKDRSESVKALEDIKPLLEDLKARAIERIRDFVAAQIKAVRSPNINAQVIQSQHLANHAELFSFLARQHPVLSEEIGQAYINTMKWYYSSNFTRYQQALQKLQIHNIDQTDLMGADPNAKRNALGTSKPPPQYDTFSLGRRLDILRSSNPSALPSYLAEDSKLPSHLEVPFRHFNLALIDNVTQEYATATSIFPTTSYQNLSRKVNEIFEPTFTLGHAFTKSLIESTTDALGILLCVRLNQHFAFDLQRRKCPIADNYINYTNILLWPRFQLIMDQHCESLRKVPTQSNRGAAAAFSLVGVGGGGAGTGAGAGDPSKTSVAPHFITQRFGQFLHSILLLSGEAGDEQPLSNGLTRLRGEYEALMAKLAKAAGGDKSKQARFLGNNFSLVLTIIGDAPGKFAGEQKEHFARLIAEAKGR